MLMKILILCSNILTLGLVGTGEFFFGPNANQLGSGERYLRFFFHVAYVSSATTIASGAMAERQVSSFSLYSFELLGLN